MSAKTVNLPIGKYRLLVAIRYFNASSLILGGMKQQCGTNDFYFLITLRSFIEYTRRGIWFLVWASNEKLRGAEKLTFARSGSPNLIRMDEMIHEALGKGKVSSLLAPVKGMAEPFVDCLHALTHGNPISVRMLGFGLNELFQTDKLLLKAEMERDLFATLVCRRALGEEFDTIWKTLSVVYGYPDQMKTAAKIAAFQATEAGIDMTGT